MFCSFDEQTGFIQYLTGFGGVEQPTFQCFDGERHILYTVSETENDGHVYGFRVSPSLTCEQMFCVRSLGGSPCHLALNPSGDSLAVANYATGTFTCLRFNECNYTENFAGKGTHPVRQERSHIHSSLWTDEGSSVLVADLGLDRIIWYKDCFTLKQYIQVPPGTGPRHMAISTDKTMLFVAGELSSEVLVIQLGPEPSVVQTISTLPLILQMRTLQQTSTSRLTGASCTAPTVAMTALLCMLLTKHRGFLPCSAIAKWSLNRGTFASIHQVPISCAAMLRATR